LIATVDQTKTSSSASENVPRHVAVIMDGNGRWAQKRGWPRIKGHEQGSQAVGECVQGCLDTGVKFLTLYAFSLENWKRPAAEVQGLMLLLERFLDQKTKEMIEKGVQLRTIGRTADLPAPCRKRLEKTIAATAGNDRLVLTLALNYGGRAEIVDAVREIVREANAGYVREEDVTPERIAAHLYTRGMPDPDLLIRTSGELRISNFLLWQLSYTEIHVTEKLWPDFTKVDLLAALEDYSKRHRRYGGV